MCWFVTKDWAGFQVAREEVLLSFMRVVEEAGSSFAFPTRTLHVASLKSS
jgi:MscS family membrane protein